MSIYNYSKKEEFKEFCETNGYTKGSSSSYATYLGKLVEYHLKNIKYNEECIFDLLPRIAAYDKLNETYYVLTVINLLYFIVNKNPDLSKKAYNDGRSALAAYEDFVFADDFSIGVKHLNKGEILSIITRLQVEAINKVYDYQLLSANFLARLRTQDRYPIDGVYYPIRVLSKVLGKDFRLILREQVNQILIYTTNDKSQKPLNIHVSELKNVRKMVLKDVYIEVKFINDKNTYYLLSENASYILDGSGQKYIIQHSKGIEGLNIQHKPAIHGELQNTEKYPGLLELKSIINYLCNKENIEPKSQYASKIAKHFTSQFISDNIDEKLKEKLLKDVCKLDGSSILSLMDEKENKKVNDK